MRRRFVSIGSLLVVAGAFALGSASASACPMCNQSIANENAMPRAYMYSILFMLGMPATVFTGFGIFLHRKFSAHYAAQHLAAASEPTAPAASSV